MDEDDLEYHINFPIPNSYESYEYDASDCKPSTNFEENDQLLDQMEISASYSESKATSCFKSKYEPVVFLLGWLNAQDRHLAKYSSLYNELGCITIRYTSPGKDLFSVTHYNLKCIARKLLSLMDDTALSHHPIIFHNFSNNGSVLYSHISNEIENAPKKLLVVGCIFDSAPSPPRLISGVKAIYYSTKGHVIVRCVTCAVVCVGLCFWRLFSFAASFFTGRVQDMPPWNLLKEPFRWPQLFLYSKGDRVIPERFIEEFAKTRESLNVAVSRCKFDDSPHVMHLKAHPKEYRSAVSTFLQECLRN